LALAVFIGCASNSLQQANTDSQTDVTTSIFRPMLGLGRCRSTGSHVLRLSVWLDQVSIPCLPTNVLSHGCVPYMACISQRKLVLRHSLAVTRSCYQSLCWYRFL